MSNGHGGRRPGAGRKRKYPLDQPPPIAREDSVKQLLDNAKGTHVQPTTVKRLAHKVAYMEQELEFIKKIILASLEERQ